MTSITSAAALLLCSISWFRLSLARTVEAWPGEDITLHCSNTSVVPSQLIWFRFSNRSQPRCISSIFSADQAATFCTKEESHKFEVTSNVMTIFLKIKHVALSDSGLYFCGYHSYRYPTILNSTYVSIRGEQLFPPAVDEPGETTRFTTLILSGVTLLLTKIAAFLAVQMTLH